MSEVSAYIVDVAMMSTLAVVLPGNPRACLSQGME